MNDAELYNSFNQLQRRDAERVVADYVCLMRWGVGDDRVLDIGCGDGHVTSNVLVPALPGPFAAVTGADVSPKMVKYATMSCSAPNMDFVVMDVAKEVPIESHLRYDHVFSFNCLHWVQDQRTVIKNIYSMLTSGGDCLISLIAKNAIYDVYKMLKANPKWGQYMKDLKKFVSPYHESANPKIDLQNLMNSVGFRDIQIDYKERVFYFEDVKSLKKSMFAVNPFLANIPSHLHDDYFDDYMSHVKELDLIEEDNNNFGDKVRIRTSFYSLIAYAVK